MNNIEDNICQAIDIIVQRAIAQADYDKTIQATIIECVDQSIGRYKIRYQDSTFYAYSSSSDVSYSSGTLVYVLIPAGNMSKDKTILGAVKNLGTNYVVDTQGEDRYNIVGDNCIKDEKNQTFGLRSYLPTRYVKTLYAKDEEVQNVISVNEASLAEYIKEADSIICAATFKTALAAEQQFNGNYGLLIAIDFADNSTGELITRNYVLDVNRMQGNPYRLINDTRQVVIFDVDGANYAGVNNISIFCYDFPHNKPEDQCEEDIWIKNIELSVAQRKTQEELNGYSISFVTTKGTCFDQTHTEDDALTIKAQVRVKGKIVDPSTQTVDFYWFIEDVNVTSQSEKNYIYYNQYGGQGWRCLNESNLVEAESPDERATVQWTPAGDTWSVVKKTVAAKETVFKCVAIYDGIAISKEITIKRLDSKWDVTIVSDQGTQFYFDSGKTTLTCLVNGQSSPNDYTYCWANVNKDDYFSTLAETIESNTTYDELVKKYNELKGKIEREEVLASQSEQELNNLSNQINSFDKVTRVDKNAVYNVVANSISSFSVFKCSVYQGDTFLGTGSITLVNSLSAEGVWSVVLHDGTQIFKYNERGVSPTEPSNLRPTVIVPLTFTVYDNLGNAVEDSAVSAKDVQWIVPMGQTMLKMSAEGEYVDNEDGTRTYTGLKTFPYEIASSYNIRNQKNDITLLVDYKGMRLTAMTDFVFTKQGESGTNGSDYICRIVPNCADGCPDAPMVTKIAQSNAVQWNFNPATANIPFKVQLWHNDDIIFTDTKSGTSSEGKPVTVIWSMLQNKYTSSVLDASTFTVDKDTGVFTYGTFNEANPANILKVEVRHNEVTYYDDMPIITALVNSGFNVRLKRHTGFDHVLYSSDGKKPIYDNSEPFELEVTELINGWTEDISLKEEQYALEYEWYPLGTIMEKYPPEQVNDISLIEAPTYGQEELNKNQKAYKVIDTYDGQCVNNAIQCLIEQGGNQVAKIHMPVHLMLDRYGNSAVNGWDGNSVSISNEGGFILAPQMGAGYKETDNSFTGVVMGKVKEGLNAEEVGLFGYYHGQRSIFLDAKTGIARFGLAGIGQIIIDPTSGTAKLYSGGYEEGKGGMLIDLTTPEIKYGNGNFSVNKNGQLIAKGEGSRIADCVIEGGVLKVPAANITGQLVAGQIAVGAVNTDNLSETLNNYIESIQSAAAAAQGTADSATADAAAAQGSADAANAAAGKAQSAADKAQSTADAANTTASNVDKIIAEWCWNHNVTYIDGAHIYTGTITADKIDVNDLFAQNITATGTITGLTLKGSKGEFTGRIEASEGWIGGQYGFTIQSNKLYTNGHSTYDYSGSGVYIGTDYISVGSGGTTWFKDDGKFQLGGSNGIKYDGYTMTLGSSIHLSWGQVTGTDNIATVGDIPTTEQITQITRNTVTTSYVNALKVTAEHVAAENITGTTITGKTISGGTISGASFSGCTGNFTGSITANSGYIGGTGGFTITTGKLYSGYHSTYNANYDGVYIGTDYISLGKGGISWLRNNGYFQLGGSSGITYSGGYVTFGSNVSLGSNVKIAWSQVTGTSNVATKSDIPSDSHITQITNNAISTATIKASQISAGTLSAMTLSGCTGSFTGSVTATSIWVKERLLLYADTTTAYGEALRVRDTRLTDLIVGGGFATIEIGKITSTSQAVTISKPTTVSGQLKGDTYNGSNYVIVGSASTSTAQVAYIGTHASTFAVNGTWGGLDFSSRQITAPSSDIRLKTNIKDCTINAMNVINQMRIRQFDWINDGRHQKIGFVADELELIDSNLSVGGGYDEDGCMNVKSVNDFYLLGFVVKAIQELYQDLNRKEAEIAYLKTQIAKIA